MAKHLTILACVLFYSLFLPGCATNPITGRSQAMLVSDNDAAQQSSQAYSQLLAQAQQKKTLDEDTASLNRVQSISRPLITEATKLRPATASWNWDVHVLNSNEVNAWCMAGGKIAVYTGLLNKIKPTDDELAQVLGHEIAHALLSHQAEKMSRAQMQKMGVNIGILAGMVAGYNLSGIAGMADQLATVGLQLPNSREAEAEADSVGIELAAKAGYNPEAAVTLWEKMLKVGGSSGKPDWLSTHPNPQARIKAMEIKAKQLMPVYQANRQNQQQ